jgi:hypothetical protein
MITKTMNNMKKLELKYEPKIDSIQLEKVARKFMQIVGRDFDAEFEEWKNKQLLNIRDEVVG